jgi:hypothetical protein
MAEYIFLERPQQCEQARLIQTHGHVGVFRYKLKVFATLKKRPHAQRIHYQN